MNGDDPKNLNRVSSSIDTSQSIFRVNLFQTIVPVDYGHIAATTSTWLYAHLAQLVISNEYRMFDLGEKQNMIRYGTATPPPYPLENITSKHIALFRGQNDALADVKDVNHLVNRLTGKSIKILFQKKNFVYLANNFFCIFFSSSVTK